MREELRHVGVKQRRLFMLNSLLNGPKTDRLREELNHLRKECRSQARKLEDMQHLQTAREDEGGELRSKVGGVKRWLKRTGI